MSFFNPSITPVWSLILPGFYHASRGRYMAGLIWAIAVYVLMPTVILGLLALLLCFLSAKHLSKTWNLSQDSLSSALQALPFPSSQWIFDHTDAVKISIPQRQINERPLRPEQRKRILEMSFDMDLKALDALGEIQAAALIDQIIPRQAKLSKELLARFYRQRGYSVSDSLIQKIAEYYSLSREERKLREEKELLEEIKTLISEV